MKLFPQDSNIFLAAVAAALFITAIHTETAHAQQISRPQAIRAQPWTESSWVAQQAHGPRPAAYLFTASYCGSCVEAFNTLKQASQQSHHPVKLIAVFTDLNPIQAADHARHFSGLTRLYAFDGFEPAIRQSIDPQWPQITPYIVLMNRQGQIQRILGTPEPQALEQWLQ
ncbi:MAG: TlpA family protein disulfide reductase [Burkholderiales bacterium]